jgi:hypothetical protein
LRYSRCCWSALDCRERRSSLFSRDNQDHQDASDDAKAVCTAMQAKGIEIYTVGFDLDLLPSSERTIAEHTL